MATISSLFNVRSSKLIVSSPDNLAAMSTLVNNKHRPKWAVFIFVRGQGLEPRLTGPEPVVLPLDDPRVN